MKSSGLRIFHSSEPGTRKQTPAPHAQHHRIRRRFGNLAGEDRLTGRAFPGLVVDRKDFFLNVVIGGWLSF